MIDPKSAQTQPNLTKLASIDFLCEGYSAEIKNFSFIDHLESGVRTALTYINEGTHYQVKVAW